jgi:hypothetical protein
LSSAVLEWMASPTADGAHLVQIEPDSWDDEQITLWALYAMHETGFVDVSDELEWSPALLGVRARLEEVFETRLEERRASADVPATDGPIAERIFALVANDDGPSLAKHVHRHATAEPGLQLLRWRSLYHLREADPTTWVIPRLGVVAKAALVELQYDEYGGGDPAKLHSNLFARGMEASGLDPTLGAYVDEAPAEVLELNNALSLFGLHRRRRAAAMGHLAAFEATSSLPSRKMAQGLERLGFPGALVDYYTEHVEADAVHEQLAARDICGAVVEEDPALADDVLFGAFTCLDLENRFAGRALAEWEVA